MEVAPSEDPAVIPIHLSADFYFQKHNKEWVMTKKTGQITSERFSDWTTDAKALRLQAEGKLEQSIDPPEPKGK